MATLSKFGVPLGGGTGRGGILQPKHKNRFRVRVVNFGAIAGGLELTQNVDSVGRPTIDYQDIDVDSYVSKAHYLSKHKWNPINLSLRDDITNTVSRIVGHQNQKQLNHFEQTAFASGTNYKFIMLIENMDGGNDVVLESWLLEGCSVTNFDYGDLSYKDTDYQTINLTIRYDNATQADGLMTTLPEYIRGSMV